MTYRHITPSPEDLPSEAELLARVNEKLTLRNVEPNSERFVLFCLVDCPTCEAKGKVVSPDWGLSIDRCGDCRGEGKQRSELGSCGTEEALGVMLATLGREGQLDGCAHGCLDTQPDCPKCERYGCEKCGWTGIKPTGSWLWRPWLPSPRNASDAGRVLAKSKKSDS